MGTLDAILDKFFSHMGYKAESRIKILLAINMFLKYSKENQESDLLYAYLNHLQARNLASNTVSAYLYRIKSFYKYIKSFHPEHASNAIKILNQIEQLPPNIFKPRNSQQIRPHIEEDDIDKLLTQTKNIKWRLIYKLTLNTALRPAEIARIKIKDITHANNFYISVNRKGISGDFTKVPISKHLYKEIQSYIRYHRESGKTEFDDQYLFLARQRTAISAWGISYIIKTGLQRINLLSKDRITYSSYCLRRTAIDNFRDHISDNPMKVQAFAGHKSFNTTLIYLKKQELDSESCNKISAMYGGHTLTENKS